MQLRIALVFITIAPLTGCYCLDDYPHNEDQMTQADTHKAGAGSFGGFNSNVPIVLANGDTSTRSATTAVTK